MRNVWTSALFLLAAAATAVADPIGRSADMRCDLAPVALSGSLSPASVASSASAAVDRPASASLPAGALLAASNAVLPTPAAAAARAAGDLPVGGLVEPARVTVEAPPLPGSVALSLSGFLTLGAWQVARRARQVHLALPVWYHEGAPHRIGHAAAFEPGVSLEAVPACLCVPPAVSPPAGSYTRESSRESLSRFQSQFISPVTAPRGPPNLA